MSRLPDNDNIRNDIYENLPCQTMFNESVRKIKANESIVLNNCNQNSNKKPNLSKELLYAAPLRKSERYKSGDRSRYKVHNETTDKAEKAYNVEYKVINKDNVGIKNGSVGTAPTSGPTTAKSSTNGSIGVCEGSQENSLEDRRILNFLKDTTQVQRKVEMGKDCPNASFSCLAREEHFANLVQQNFTMDPNGSSSNQTVNTDSDSGIASGLNKNYLDDFEQEKPTVESAENLEVFMDKKQSPDKEVNGLVGSPLKYHLRTTSVYINREWALKKIALCLEQRATSKKPISGIPGTSSTKVSDETPGNAASCSAFLGGRSGISQGNASSSYHGCLVLGSNGSGKTSICQSIMNGNSGTRGLLNRKLLSCYFVNSQNPDCHSLSLFMRSIVLQILSHSSLIGKERAEAMLVKEKATISRNTENVIDESQTNFGENNEEILIAELTLDENRISNESAKAMISTNDKKSIVRQKSAPSPEKKSSETEDLMRNTYSTHPPSGAKSSERNKNCNDALSLEQQKSENDDQESASNNENSEYNNKPKSSPSKKSKIPVAITTRVPKNNNAIQQGGGEDIADIGDELKNDIEAEINDDSCPPDTHDDFMEKDQNTDEPVASTSAANTTEPLLMKSPETSEPIIPPPLPKSKSCRTVIADGYYEMLLSNPEILECLNVDNIEKNPDECFKKALLFPLLELTPPRTALLFLIDSIDENYINEGNLISTLKGRCLAQKSRNIAELLSNHIHLFPKWLFLVATTKKQNKHVTKMFSGFKKITLDDLRKSHVVKDVQEYIINRLNSDFKGTINLTKEIIESLHQLYIKSNGCILYLEKVLDGIKDNFFSFREIKLIPCTLNGLYLYICQKSFNKKQYLKIRPILNILLASTGLVDKLFVFNCLRTHNYAVDFQEFETRLEIMRNILTFYQGGNKLKIFHNSFADWLVDVKFSTKKFLCDVNEGHVMISMYYTLVSETLCPNNVRRFVNHLIKSGEYLAGKNVNLDLMLMLLESRVNLSDCFYTNLLNCCSICEEEFKNDENFLTKTRNMLERFLMNELNDEFSTFLCDFFKPNLPTDTKTLKLLIETGINNMESQASCDSSLNSPEFSEKSQNIDCELADLLISTEKTCQQEMLRPKSSSDRSEPHLATESVDEDEIALHQISETHRIEMHKGKALVHILANEGNHILFERALKACKGPIDLEIEDYNGQSALNIAARNGHLDVVKLLLTFKQTASDGSGRQIGVDVNHADRDGWTPLRSASWGGHTDVVKLLIAHPGCMIDLADKEGRTALRAAAWSGHEDILKILIEAGADVNSVDRQGRTSLIAASYMGHYDIVEILLENGANVNHLDLDGRSALCVAALCGSSGYSKVISTLLEHGANTDQLDNDGMSPLLVSSFEGNAEICELLLENGADPDLADFMGRTPLWAACTAGHASVVKLLLFWGCGIDCMDSEGRTVLSIAAAQGNVETVRQLLDRGLDETHRDNAGWTPLHYAAFEGFHDVCVQLLESGAKIDECDNEGKTALHLASQEGRQACVQVLLEIHCAFVDQKAHDGKTAFRLACLEGHVDCIQTILKFGCDVNCKDADSRTTLYILALENKLDIVKYLLDVTDIDVNIPDSEGRSPLHVAAWQGHTDMVKMLVTLGNADVNAMDLECRTPLHSCAWQGNHEVMEILLYFGAIPDHACKQGATALGISAQEGHEKCVAILLKYGANPYKSDHCGRTPMKLAAKSNRNSILKIFDSYTKTDESNLETRLHPNLLRSPDNPPERPTGFLITQQHSTNHLGPNNNMPPPALNASNSTHSSNFYENTMQSDNSSLQKRKSIISSQSTGSSNEAPLSFTQQLQRHSKLNSRNNPFVQVSPNVTNKKSKGHHKHSQMLPDLDEYQINIASNAATNDADMFDMECMSPLYATPPHSPSSELSSPGQLPSHLTFEEIGGGGNAFVSKPPANADHHFARDTHMRIILGNNKESNHSSSKSKRSGIATNPAVRMIRSRFDSAAQLIRRTNNILNITSSSNQGSSSIGVKSGTFQWRKESQM